MPRLTALHRAVEQGDFEEVQRLLTEGADVNAVACWVHPSPTVTASLNNITPLHIAACLGHREIAALLLQHGANPNANQQRNPTTVNILFLIQQLFLSPLLLITCFSSIRFSPYLIFPLVANPKIGAILYLSSAFFSGTLIMLECMTKLPSHFLSRLLNPLPLTFLPLTPLHLALEYGQDHMVELLLNHGANINQLGYNTDYEAVTPLLIASKKGNFNVVKLLLERGASPNSMRNEHFRLGSIARRLISNSVQRNFENVIFQFILPGDFFEREFKFYVLLEKYFFSRTPLHEAAYQGHEHIVALLLEYGADSNAICLERVLRTSECFKMTPLHYAFYTLSNGIDQALKHRKTEIAKLLLKKMPNPPASLINELLHLATESCDSTNVELLIKQGADVNSRLEKNSLTPLHRVFMTRLFPSKADVPFYKGMVEVRLQGNHENKDVAAERLALLRLLIISRADVNAIASKGLLSWQRFMPLSLAIQSCWPEAVDILLENKIIFDGKIPTIAFHYLFLDPYRADKEEIKAILIKMLQCLLKNTNHKSIMEDIIEDREFPWLFELAKRNNETKLVKILYPFEIYRNLGEENLLQARVKNAFEYLIQHGRIRAYHYDCIRQCQHALVQDYLRTFDSQLLEMIEEESENVPALKALIMDYILQNSELFSKQDLEKLTPDLKAELKEANTSMPPLTLSYPITSHRSWQELRARHRQRQQNNLYDDESINANDNTETEIKIKVL